MLSNDKKFLMDMLYSKTSTAAPLSPTTAPNPNEEESGFLPGEIDDMSRGDSHLLLCHFAHV